ncbi:hypothetical protein J6590_033969 [Homalodisca vitripennis]|nr:hypothetical protein J6590_033969 [Homalodisca vitripennis]
MARFKIENIATLLRMKINSRGNEKRPQTDPLGYQSEPAGALVLTLSDYGRSHWFLYPYRTVNFFVSPEKYSKTETLKKKRRVDRFREAFRVSIEWADVTDTSD